MELCLDRACEWQEMFVHFAHKSDADFLSIEVAINGFDRELESMKSARGRRCAKCARLLIPTDNDHTFCDDCWDDLMYHPFEEHRDGTCALCGETENDKVHQRKREGTK